MRRWFKLCVVLFLILGMGTACGKDNAVEQLSKGQDGVPSNFYEVLGEAEFEGCVECVIESLEDGSIRYGDLDKLGRPSGVFAKITSERYAKEKEKPRQEIKVDPVGWVKPNPKVVLSDGDNSYKGYLYNRSHLLADSLGGEPIVKNLITGTRLQNVGWNTKGKEGGMAYGETLARDWLSKNTGYILYEVICHYNGNDLISDYQIVNIKSSDGAINKKIKVYNGTGSVKVEYVKGEKK